MRQRFYTLTASVSADGVRQTRMVYLSFQLEGIPLDTAPLLQLCQSIGVHDGLYFRPHTKKSLTRGRTAKPLIKHVKPLGYIISPETLEGAPPCEWVTGIVIANPFHESAGDDSHAPTPDGLEGVARQRVPVCDLAQHHRQDAGEHTYYLRNVEHARTSDALVCRPVANWD
jgi:hypothetical protein